MDYRQEVTNVRSTSDLKQPLPRLVGSKGMLVIGRGQGALI